MFNLPFFQNSPYFGIFKSPLFFHLTHPSAPPTIAPELRPQLATAGLQRGAVGEAPGHRSQAPAAPWRMKTWGKTMEITTEIS